MFKNYLKIIWRNLFKNKVHSFINIAGLAISIASCLILYYMIRFELSFDTFHTNNERTYRVVNESHYPEGIDYGQGVPAPLPAALRLDFPQISKVATIFSDVDSEIEIIDGSKPDDQTKFREELGVFFSEPQFFEIFDFKWLYGSPGQSLTDPNTVVLTQETAEKYFGNWRNAIGKFIRYRNADLLKVTGILKNIPVNSDFPIKVVISYKTREEKTGWRSTSSRRQCYILLGNHTTPAQVQVLMPAFEKKHAVRGGNTTDHYRLQPLNDIHFNQLYGNFNKRITSKGTLLSLGLIGIFLMITAAINFVNLAIAQVIKKSKEVGVRKVLGSTRVQLFLQFYGETFLLVILASLLGVVITEISLPVLTPLLNFPLNFNIATPWEISVVLVMMSLIIATLSAFYPASIMARFKPVLALKNKITNQTVGGTSFRKSLIVVQFTIAQVLIVATLIVVQQLDYFRNAPLGFNKHAIIQFSIPQDSVSQSKLEPFRKTLLQLPGTENLSFSFAPPLSESNRRTTFQFERSEDSPFEANLKYADVSFFQTYGITLAAGRIYQSSDTAREFVVNQTFLEKWGIADPKHGIGKLITLSGATLPIVGVVNDFHLQPLQEKIEPLIMMCNKSQYKNAGVKIDPRKIKEAVQQIEDIYARFFPDNVFEYRFMDETIANHYANEERLATLTNIFSVMAILISCLGLYGLISFMAVQRTKEVGIRKVLGATVPNILSLFYKEFVLLVLIAFAVSAPVAWYFMSDWLNGFAYRINLNAWIFIIAMILTLTIALATISFQSIKAALANPVKSLRTE